MLLNLQLIMIVMRLRKELSHQLRVLQQHSSGALLWLYCAVCDRSVRFD